MREAVTGTLPAGLEQAFRVAAGELGMCSAAWLFVREVADAGGPPSVAALRDALGRTFPVLDAVATLWAAGAQGPAVEVEGVRAACAGAHRLVVVGLESAFLDALVPQLPDLAVALLAEGPFARDEARVLSNYGGRVEAVGLADFQAWAGPRSALLTFAYGVHGERTHVLPTWLRVAGEDVRTQFRALVAWDVLRAPMYVYPRWLVEAPRQDFTHLV